MAISPEVLSQLQQAIQSGDADDLTEQQIVEILNQNRSGDSRFVTQDQASLPTDIPNSVFKEFDRDDIVTNRRQLITQGVWSGGVSELTDAEMFLSECQQTELSGRYFYEVWDKDPDTGGDVEAARIQFYVSYGNRNGGGSLNVSVSNSNALEVTKATYFQYKNILLPEQQEKFEFGDAAAAPDDFYAINIARSRYKQIFDPGNWQLRLRFNDPFDSGGTNHSICTLVDESAETDFDNEQIIVGQVGRVLDVVSGSLNLDTNDDPDVIHPDDDLLDGTKTYGKFYPDVGIILLNPKALAEHARKVYQEGPTRSYDSTEETFVYDETLEEYKNSLIPGTFPDASTYDAEGIDRADGIEPDTGTDAYKFNHGKLFDAIEAGGSFVGRSVEEVNSTHYFVRVRNRDFNFSNNPTFSQNDGSFTIPSFFKNPKVFITTVGLYDDENTLVAVAKLSKPVQKDFGREALLEIKLDY